MKRHFIKKYIFSVLFLLVLAGFSAVNLYHTFPIVRDYLEKHEWSDISEFVSGLEAVISDNVYQKYAFVECYGFAEKMLGSNIDNGFDYVKSKDGQMHFSNRTDDWVDIEKIMEKLGKIDAMAEENGAETLLFLTPQKYIEGESEFAMGVPYSDRTKELDEVRKLAEKSGMECVDSRDYLDEIKAQTGKPVFFQTDHHWRPEAGFYMYGVLLDVLQDSWETELNPDGFYTNPENYNIREYENYFLGSMGREAGVVYSGMDDFTLMYPKFETDFLRNYRMTADGAMNKAEGTAYQSLYSVWNLEYNDSVYRSDRYGTYLNGVNVEDHITNRMNPDGPRILVIRDSYMSVPGVFLANNCSQLDMLWLINYDGDFKSLVENGNYDYVIVQLSGLNMSNVRLMDFVEG